MKRFDLIIRNGHVVDPATGLTGNFDIGIKDGVVVAIEPTLPDIAHHVYDVDGGLVCPGLIDFHTHVYWGGAWGIKPDELGPRAGVTTFVDFGTAGPGNFPGFLEHVIYRSKSRILAFLHIAYTGLSGAIFEPKWLRIVGELEDIRRALIGPAIEVAQRYPKVIRGIKVRASIEATGSNGIHALMLAKQASEVLGIPLAVHMGEPPLTSKEILPYLDEGDILTHSFRGLPNSLLDRRGKIISEALEARERGVVFDVGHGQSSFSFRVAAQLIEQGFLPDIISSDVHAYNINGPVYDLPTTMSKFLALGLDVEYVIRATTYMPAKVLSLENELGSLQVGRVADVTVLKLEEGNFPFYDAYEEQLSSRYRFVPVMTFRAGQLLWYDKRFLVKS